MLKLINNEVCFRCGNTKHMVELSNRAHFCGSCNFYYAPNLVSVKRIEKLEVNLVRIKQLHIEMRKLLNELEQLVK